MNLNHYYKIKIYVDNGMERFETWKYVFAETSQQAIQRLLNCYQGDIVRVIEVYDYPITDVMIFSERNGMI